MAIQWECVAPPVKFPQLGAPPEPLNTLLTENTSEPNHFVSNIRKYNSRFQMTSFGDQIEDQGHFMPVFKVKVGKSLFRIYYRGGFFLPFSGEHLKILHL